MSIHQTVSFQEALDIVESLPEDQRETLVAVARPGFMEHTRDMLSKHIEEAREELSRGEMRRGTVDDLMKELSDENAQMG
jgi:prefoldin subunit 5